MTLARELRCNPKLICADLEPVNPSGIENIFYCGNFKKNIYLTHNETKHR